MKMVAISLGTECVKSPPCSFCYQAQSEPVKFEKYAFKAHNIITNLVDKLWRKEEVTFCFEYSGLNLSAIGDKSSWTWRSSDSPERGSLPHYTMTTMHFLITPILAGYLKRWGIEAVALSYDREHVPDGQLPGYIKRVKILQDEGIKVSCNYLFGLDKRLPPTELMRTVDQLNILALKPTDWYTPEIGELLKEFITVSNSIVPTVTDNCLGVLLGNTDKCHRGEDFIHVMPDGTITDCCFKQMCSIYKENTDVVNLSASRSLLS